MKEEATFRQLVESIRATHRELAAQAGKAVNISLTLRNWLIGYYVAEYELNGKDRALYGERLFSELGRELKALSNCNRRQLYRYYRFYTFYPEIVGSLPPQFKALPLLPAQEIVGTPSPQSKSTAMNLVTRLSYSHFDELVDIDDATKRAFYEVECIHGNWSVFEIGRRIVEHEQKGAERAEYGKALIKELSAELTAEFGRGFSHRNLDYMRKFYLAYKERSPQIPQTPSAKSAFPFQLSWSQYVFLISIDNPEERRFYEIEAAANGWTLPELKRQFNSGLFERLALSRDKDGVRKLAEQGQIVSRPEDLLKEPYVLEFLGLDEKVRYSESDLESSIIDKLEHFLLELGKGFLFEARQKRFTFIHAKEYQLYLPDKELLHRKLEEWSEEAERLREARKLTP